MNQPALSPVGRPTGRRSFALRASIASLGIVMAVAGCSSSKSAGSSSSSDASTPPGSTGTGAAAALVPSQFKGGVTVATSQGYPPTDFVDANGKTTGFDYDLGQALAGKLGIPFKFTETTFAAIIPGILAKKYDLVMDDMNDTKAREQQKLTFVDYFQGGRALVVPAAKAGAIKSMMDLCGKTVATTSGTSNADEANAASTACTAAGKPKITVLELANGADNLLAIKSGKAVAELDDDNTAGYSVLQSKGAFALVPLPQYKPAAAGIGMLSSNAGLAKAIQSGLQELEADGTYQKLLAKYGLTHNAVSDFTIDGAVS